MDTRLVIYVTDCRAYAAVYERRRRSWVRSALANYEVEFPFLPRTESDVSRSAAELARRLREEFPSGAVARLVIPANWCFTQSVEMPTERWADQSAAFELEPYIPVELESLTSAARRVGRRGAVVVGVHTEAMERLVNELEACSIHTEIITVDTMLLTAANGGTRSDCTWGVLLVDHRRLSVAFAECPDRPGSIQRTLCMAPPEDPTLLRHQMTCATVTERRGCRHWRLMALDDGVSAVEFVALLRGRGHVVEECPPPDTIRYVADLAMGDDVLDLRKDGLAYAGTWGRVRARAASCAVALLFFVLSAAVSIRADNVYYGRALAELRPATPALYHEVFPGQDVPPGAALRVRSECIKLKALTSQRGDGAATAVSRGGLAALELLDDAIRHVPADMKLYVTEIAATEVDVRVGGQTTAHDAAGRLVQALNTSRILAADPPRTKLLKDRTVEFRIHLKRETDETSE